jgi:hypothetical protein
MDLALNIISGAIAISLAVLGGTVSSTKRWHKPTFIILGVASLILCVAIGVRSSRESRAAEQKAQQDVDGIKNQLAESEIRRASDTRYLEGTLEVFGQFAPAIMELARASELNTRKQFEQKELSNKQLEELVKAVVKKMKDWQSRYDTEESKVSQKYFELRGEAGRAAGSGGMTEAMKQKWLELGNAELREERDLSNRYMNEFNQNILGDAIYAKNQLDGRINPKDRLDVPDQSKNLLLVFQGIIVGAQPVGMAANYLEQYAKKLSPQ